MKPLPLLACLAVSATAVSAELKDPNQVARDWHQNIDAAAAPLVGPLGLQAQVSDQRYPGLTRVFESPADKTPDKRTPPAPRYYDAPAAPRPADPMEVMPRGSKRWHFNGSDYWLVPLGN
jgi:hypothetical protein